MSRNRSNTRPRGRSNGSIKNDQVTALDADYAEHEDAYYQRMQQRREDRRAPVTLPKLKFLEEDK